MRITFLFLSLGLGFLIYTNGRAENTNAAAAPAAPPPNPTLVPSERTDSDGHLRFLKQVERVKQGPIDLLFLGDSITGCFFEQGQTDWNARYAKLNAAAFGIAGDAVQNVLWRIENGDLTGISPKLVVLLIGTNNLGNCSPLQIADGIKNLVSEIKKRAPSAHILVLGLLPRGQKADNGYRPAITQINQLISSLDDGKQVTYLDFGSQFLQPNGDMIEGITFDYTHPNNKGCHIWYEAIQPIVDKYVPQPR